MECWLLLFWELLKETARAQYPKNIASLCLIMLWYLYEWYWSYSSGITPQLPQFGPDQSNSECIPFEEYPQEVSTKIRSLGHAARRCASGSSDLCCPMILSAWMFHWNLSGRRLFGGLATSMAIRYSVNFEKELNSMTGIILLPGERSR